MSEATATKEKDTETTETPLNESEDNLLDQAVDSFLDDQAALERALADDVQDEEALEKSVETEQRSETESVPDEESDAVEDKVSPAAVEDDLLARAIRAGMTPSDAKSIGEQDAEALERQVGLLERVAEGEEGSSASEDSGEGEDGAVKDASGIDKLLETVPDLDPDIYDEGVVAGFNSLKEVIKQQDATIRKLFERQSSDWLGDKIDGLGLKKVSPDDRSSLSEQFEVLKAGYESKGREVSDDEIFNQASTSVFGERLKEPSQEAKKQKLDRRVMMQTERANTARPPKKEKTGVKAMEDIADEIDREYFSTR